VKNLSGETVPLGTVLELRRASLARAMRTAEVLAIGFHALADDAAAAMTTRKLQGFPFGHVSLLRLEIVHHGVHNLRRATRTGSARLR
jgi:hypothetical protein